MTHGKLSASADFMKATLACDFGYESSGTPYTCQIVGPDQVERWIGSEKCASKFKLLCHTIKLTGITDFNTGRHRCL